MRTIIETVRTLSTTSVVFLLKPVPTPLKLIQTILRFQIRSFLPPVRLILELGARMQEPCRMISLATAEQM
uniref:Uncharacterized protein n=1 Tax=Ditylenchus dipsaci TaxID=166011 RepID=A0A915DYZ0_9BILA